MRAVMSAALLFVVLESPEVSSAQVYRYETPPPAGECGWRNLAAERRADLSRRQLLLSGGATDRASSMGSTWCGPAVIHGVPFTKT